MPKQYYKTITLMPEKIWGIPPPSLVAINTLLPKVSHLYMAPDFETYHHGQIQEEMVRGFADEHNR